MGTKYVIKKTYRVIKNDLPIKEITEKYYYSHREVAKKTLDAIYNFLKKIPIYEVTKKKINNRVVGITAKTQIKDYEIYYDYDLEVEESE